MTAVAAIRQPETGTNIVALVEATPVIVLTDKQKFSDFYVAMKAECDAHVPDLSTESSRKKTASLAYKVARTKTAIDDAGKRLNEEARSRINAVDESRREIRQQLDALKDEVRKPLTDWEEAEAERVESCEAIMASLRNVVVVPHGASAADVRERLAEVEATALDRDALQGFAPQAELLQQQAVATLTFMAEEVEQAEAERAELEKLRAEAVEREAAELAKREAEEAERRRAEQERVAEDARQRAEQDERDRITAAAKAADERARQEVEAKARDEREAAERAHAEALAAEKRRADEAEAATKAEYARIARGIEETQAIADHNAREQAKRDTDRAHRGKIMAAAKEAIMEAGSVDEATAKSIVLAIAANNVPNISIRF